MRHLKTLVCLGIMSCCVASLQAQGILNKVRRAGNTIADKVLEKKVDEAVNGQSDQNSTSTSPTSGKNKPGNKGGEGLISTPPDVKENLTSAETAFKAGSYGEARYAVQQAMLGVELEIGHQILKSLPATVNGLKKDTTDDQVTSTGWGWAGLTINREYKGTADKQLTVTIANNAVWMSAINMYFNNAGYAQTNNEKQKFKQIKVKGYRSLIEYDESSGYKISVPLGQTSLLLLQGVNFANEQEMLKAANEIDIDGIKNLLGEK